MTSNSDTSLSTIELQELGVIAGTMVPASAERRLPSAGDPAILQDIATSLGRDVAAIRAALATIRDRSGGMFAALDRDRREALINDVYAGRSVPIMVLGRVILGAYYRDERVLTALGFDAGAPFPKGYVVEQGDWSLLEVVRNRPQLWRDDR